MSISRFQLTVSNLVVVVAVAVGMGGCAGLSGFGSPVALLVFLVTLTVGGIVGCTQTDRQTGEEWTVEMDGAVDVPDARDTDRRGEGTWQQCCKNGTVQTCFCPANTACNYGLFKRCGGNKCVSRFGQWDAGCPVDGGDTGDTTDTVEPDTEPRDTSRGEGRWVTCCDDGEIDTCFCPAGTACNYGRFTHCGGDRCVNDFVAPDAGCPVDGGDTTDKF